MSLTTDLVYYYKFDESSGNASPTVGSVTLTNSGVTYVTGKINNGAEMGTSGTNSATLYNSSPGAGWFNLGAGAAKSYGWWFKANANPPAASVCRFFDWRRASAASGEMSASYVDDTGVYKFSMYCNGNYITYTTTFTAGTWYYLTLTVDSSNNGKFYINGTQVTTVTWGSAGSGGNNFFQIGNANGLTSGGFGGPFSIDELGLWHRELTSTEVGDLYNGGAGLAYPFTGATVNSGFFNLM